MACVNHPDVPEVTRCAQCRKRVCQDCYVMLDGQPLCGSCKDQVVRLVERGESVTSGERGPTPWEHGKSWASLVATVKAAALQPSDFFRSLSWQGNGHYTFLLAVGWLPGVLGAGFGYMLQMLIASLGAGSASEAAVGVGMTLGMGLLGMVCAVFWVPVQLFIGLFVGGLICHFCLYILGGANAPLEATLRTVGYAQAPAFLNVIPWCGAIVAALWTLVIQIIGLKEVHETTYGKVILAVFLPTIVCLGIIGAILAMVLPFAFRQN